MASILFVAVAFFVIGIFARELLNIAIAEWKEEIERIKKANDFAESQAER